jgi:dihydrofolate synthase/folylpolyglutamate synthase
LFTYQQALNYLYHLHLFSCKRGLDNIAVLLQDLGSPQEKLKFIHIVGTNGKGSTAAFIHSILQQAGFKVGLFTSPHLFDFRERIRIGQRLISKKEVREKTDFLRQRIEKLKLKPIFFEVTTALALLYFAERKVDWVVLEAGLGGRWDATNVVIPYISVITPISLDHTHKLGRRVEEITREKAGVIKENVPVITNNINKKILAVLRKTCEEKKTELVVVKKNCRILQQNLEGTVFKKGEDIFTLKLLGKHQIENALLAIEVIKELTCHHRLKISTEMIKKGLVKTSWPGRLEIISSSPLIILDGAHNRAAASRLRQSLKYYFKGQKFIFIIGVLQDKNIRGIFQSLSPLAEIIITTSINSPRAMCPERLKEIARKYHPRVKVIPSLKKALLEAKKIADNKKIAICITGSLYLIGEVKELEKKEKGLFS